jgi:hypothetical protein
MILRNIEIVYYKINKLKKKLMNHLIKRRKIKRIKRIRKKKKKKNRKIRKIRKKRKKRKIAEN